MAHCHAWGGQTSFLNTHGHCHRNRASHGVILVPAQTESEFNHFEFEMVKTENDIRMQHLKLYLFLK